MIHLIAPDRLDEFEPQIRQMHQLRYRVFKGRLDWDVKVEDDLEIDEFDTVEPYYLLQYDEAMRLCGTVRLLPSEGPNMLRDVFPFLAGGAAIPASPTVWESSRFSLDLPPTAPKGRHGLARATFELFAGMIEFGLWQGLSHIVTVTDARMERILKRAGWPLERLGQPQNLGNCIALAGFLETSMEALRRVREIGDLTGPVLWSPLAPTVRPSRRPVLEPRSAAYARADAGTAGTAMPTAA